MRQPYSLLFPLMSWLKGIIAKGWLLSMERNIFTARNQTLQSYQSKHFAYYVGIISCYSNKASFQRLLLETLCLQFLEIYH